MGQRPGSAPVIGFGSSSETDSASCHAVAVHVRVRPSSKPSPKLLVHSSESRIQIETPPDPTSGYVNNQKRHQGFVFNGVIGPEAEQDEVGGDSRPLSCCQLICVAFSLSGL